jgi:hypothetical protein
MPAQAVERPLKMSGFAEAAAQVIFSTNARVPEGLDLA